MIDLDTNQVLRINGTDEYRLIYFDRETSQKNYKVIIECDDNNIFNLNEITKLEILESDRTTVDKIITKYSSVSECSISRSGVYRDLDNQIIPTATIIFNQKELEDTVKKLEETVFPVVDYDSMSLDEVKETFVKKTKEALTEYLENHPIQSDCHNAKTGTYSITKEKQDLMASNYLSYTLEKALNPAATLRWNEAGKECEEWTETEFVQLILEIKAFVQPLVSHQQTLESTINASSDKKEIINLEISYENVH